jgi:aspartyl-tRNA(Asn)/glutamyl-tRNA(Gln) amidotransferase subunit A
MSTKQSWKSFFSDRKTYEKIVREREKTVGSFLHFRVGKGKDADSPVAGLPFGIKDNIALDNYPLTCGSKMLQGLLSPYTATAVQKLLDAGAVPVGKTNLDEFGMGSSTDNSALGTTNNPWDTDRVAGGSSGGSAAAVAAGLVPFALGTDTGGSVRQPAHFCGVYGLKPTYGSVSRFGLTAYASSLEVIGVLANSPELTEEVFHLIKGKDENDQTSLEYTPIEEKPVKTIGVLTGLGDLAPEVQSSYDKVLAQYKDWGYTIVELDLSTLEYVVPAYYTIAMAEASANLARYTGIRYGLRPVYAENPDELVEKSRTAGFGDEVKLRIMLGTYVLRSGFQDQYYHKAQKVRTLIRQELEKAFQKVDVILSPVFPTPAFKRGEGALTSFQQKVADKFTCTANLAGIPALSIPAHVENGLPVGFQVMAPAFGESRLFDVAKKWASEYPAPPAPGFAMEGEK